MRSAFRVPSRDDPEWAEAHRRSPSGVMLCLLDAAKAVVADLVESGLSPDDACHLLYGSVDLILAEVERDHNSGMARYVRGLEPLDEEP